MELDINAELWDFIEKASTLKDPQKRDTFFNELLTPNERHDLAARWLLMKELLSGTTQRAIAKELGLSLCKITRGSRQLKREGSVCKELLKGSVRPTNRKKNPFA